MGRMIPNVLRFWRGSDLPAHSMDELRFISGQGECASQTGMDQNGSIKRSSQSPGKVRIAFPGGFLCEKSENGENSWIPHLFYAIIERERSDRCFGRDPFLSRAL